MNEKLEKYSFIIFIDLHHGVAFVVNLVNIQFISLQYDLVFV